MKRTLLTAALASVLVLSSCGGNEEEEARTALSEYLVNQQADGQMMRLDEEQADCIAGDMVDGIGVDQLEEYGILDEDGSVDENAETNALSKDDARIMVDAMFDCTDVMATVEEQLAAAAGGQSQEVQECLEEALTEDLVRETLVASFSGNEQEAQQKMTAPLTECVTGGTDLPDNG